MMLYLQIAQIAVALQSKFEITGDRAMLISKVLSFELK